jgi:regulator of sigma E protease
MEFFSSLGGSFESFVIAVAAFLFVITIIVFFHELGHFLVARWVGIKVETFSIGFGHEIVGFNDRKGTRWKISWLPLGGYVKFLGDENAASVPDREKLKQMPEEDREGAFESKSLPRRAAVVAAGPFANFILAIAIFSAIFYFYGRTFTAPIVDEVVPGSAAERAGIMVGDRIDSVNGTEIMAFSDLTRIVRLNAGNELILVVERNGEMVTLTATPEAEEIEDQFGGKQRVGLLGVKRNNMEGDITVIEYGPGEALYEGTRETWFFVENTMIVMYGILTGRQKADQLGGPLRIAQVSGQVATVSISALVNLAAILSVGIGLINLFPIPMLDGGHLLYYAIEAVRGKPLSEKMQDLGFRLGFALVIGLMLFVTWNDLVHLDVF